MVFVHFYDIFKDLLCTFENDICKFLCAFEIA